MCVLHIVKIFRHAPIIGLCRARESSTHSLSFKTKTMGKRGKVKKSQEIICGEMLLEIIRDKKNTVYFLFSSRC